jgi:hypothetical protein
MSADQSLGNSIPLRLSSAWPASTPYLNTECPAKYEPPPVLDSELTGFLLWGHAADKLNAFLEHLHQVSTGGGV